MMGDLCRDLDSVGEKLLQELILQHVDMVSQPLLPCTELTHTSNDVWCCRNGFNARLMV
jgi:hypothetical protein